MKNFKSTTGRKGQKGGVARHDTSLMRRIVMDYFHGDLSLRQLELKYNVPNQSISRWVKHFSCELAEDINIPPMTEQEQKTMEALQKQLKSLKEKLEYEQMKNFALETLVDLAKSEMGIDLRKNSGAKQPKE